jgi:hypothetical protein
MPRVRLDLKPQTYEALAARAIEERRPIDWQAEVLIESSLGLRDRDTPQAQVEQGERATLADQETQRVRA